MKSLAYKHIALVTAVILVLMLFSGCGGSQIEKARDKIVSIGESFLDYDITADEACEQIDSVLIPDGGDGAYLKSMTHSLKMLLLKSKISNMRDLTTEIEEEIQDIKEADLEE